MNDELTRAAEAVEAVRNDPDVYTAYVMPGGEIEAVVKASTGTYREKGETIAARLDPVDFSRVNRHGRLYFTV
jgi:hypothetical protein